MSSPPRWDGPDVRGWWALDPSIAFLNHGSFGAAPRAVLAEQARLRAELERDPVDFLVRTYAERLGAARAEVAAFLGADPAGLVFVPNATTGVATVVASTPLRPGDEVVTTDHVYAGVRAGLRRAAAAAGARVVEVPLDLAAPDTAAAAIGAVLTERTALVVVDAVTSPTALVLPVAEVVAACRERGVRCLVDAAHAPGQVPVDLAGLDADAWTGNLHKWAGAPKGSAVLVVREELRDRVRPLAPGGGGTGFLGEFDWTGTVDPTPWLAAPAALRLLGELGWDRVRRYDDALAAWGARLVADALGTAPPLAGRPGAHAAMALVDPGPLDPDRAVAVREALWSAYRIEVPLTPWRDRFFVRLSAYVHNRPEDYERLAAALPGVLAAARRAQ